MDRFPFVVPGVSEKPRSPRMMEGTKLQRLMIEDLRKEISQWEQIIQDNFYHLLEVFPIIKEA